MNLIATNYEVAEVITLKSAQFVLETMKAYLSSLAVQEVCVEYFSKIDFTKVKEDLLAKDIDQVFLDANRLFRTTTSTNYSKSQEESCHRHGRASIK